MVAFILANRKGKVCKDWSVRQIRESIIESLKQNTLAYTSDGEEISGVVWGDANEPTMTLHINGIITTDKDALRLLVGYFKTHFNGWTLTADRRDKFVSYNTEKLVNKLLK